MYWFMGTGTVQQIITTAKLLVLSKTLKKCIVVNGLALILSHNIKQFTNLWNFWESVYKYAESVVWR